MNSKKQKIKSEKNKYGVKVQEKHYKHRTGQQSSQRALISFTWDERAM